MKCKIPYCREEEQLRYYEQPICYKHFNMKCNKELNLKTILNITEGEA